MVAQGGSPGRRCLKVGFLCSHSRPAGPVGHWPGRQLGAGWLCPALQYAQAHTVLTCACIRHVGVTCMAKARYTY